MNLAFSVIGALGTLLGMSSQPASTPADLPNQTMKEEIRVMPVPPTPESNTILLRLAVPKIGEIVTSSPIWMQFRIEGYALGADSGQFDRSNQVALSDLGQTVHVIIDNEPYFAINEPAINPFNEEGYFYIQSYKFKIPTSLKEGIHTLRLFPARSFGESLKGDNTFVASYFYVGANNNEKLNVNFYQPFLTYNEPSDQIPLTTSQPVLLDFLLTNCNLSADGYKVRLTIDGKVIRTLTSWQPYYIYGLSRGKHTIRLELLNESSRVPGLFNDVTRTIVIR